MRSPFIHIRAWSFRCLMAGAAVMALNAVAGAAPIAELRMASGVGFSTFDPIFATPPTVDYLRPVYDTLVVRTGADTFEPGLAKRWQYNEDNTRLELELQQGVSFQDGTPFNADVVKQNLERGRAATRSPWADVYAAIEEIEVVNDHTVVLKLRYAHPALIEYFANNPGMMVSAAALADPARLAREPVGTAPWRLVQDASTGGAYVFEAVNADWRKDEPAAQRVVIHQMTEAAARINALRNGQLDIATVPQDQATALERLGFKIMKANTVHYLMAGWDAKGENVAALANPDVRKAMGLAVNRAAVLKAIFGGRGTISPNFVGKGLAGHSDALEKSYPYDPKQAKELLAKAGYPDGFSVDAVVQSNNTRFAAAVAGELAKVGIQVNLKVMPDVGAFQSAVRQKQSPLGIFAHQSAHPFTLYSSLSASKGRYNPYQIEDAKRDELSRLAARSQGEAMATAYASLFERLVGEQAMVLPIVHADIVAALRKGLDGGPTTYAAAGLPDPRNVRDTAKAP